MEIQQAASGVASIVALGYALWPNLTHHDVKHKKLAWYAVVFFFILTLILFLTSPDTSFSNSGLVTQTGNLEISNRSINVHEVFYPISYTSTPNLKVHISVGSGELAVIKQRPDGFTFKVNDLGYSTNLGAYIEWISSGNVSDK